MNVRNICTKSRCFLGLIALALLLAASVPVFAQPARVQFTSATDQTGTTIASLQSPAFTPTAGNFLVIHWGYYRNGGSAVTVTASDLAGNTWDCSTIPQVQPGAGGAFAIQGGICFAFHIGGTLTNDKVTVAFSSNVPFVTIIPVEYSASGSSNPLDAHATGTATGAASVTSGSFTTTTPHEVISCGLIAETGETWTAGSIGGTTGSLITSVATSGLGAEDRAVSAIQSGITAAASIGGSTDLAIDCATFTAGGGTPRPGCAGQLLLMGVGCVAPSAPPVESRARRRK